MCVLLVAGVLSAAPVITFENKRVVASGITRGSDAVLFGVSRDRGDWLDHFFHWRMTAADADNDGVVSFERDKGFPPQSMLLVIDLALGEVAAASPPPLEIQLSPLDLGEARYGPSGSIVSLTQAGSRVDVLLARPGVGAWGASIADGGSLDADRAFNGAVAIDFNRLRPLGVSPADPDGVRPGDILAIADAGRPWLAVVRVTAPQGGK